jgi:hypothetical protein
LSQGKEHRLTLLGNRIGLKTGGGMGGRRKVRGNLDDYTLRQCYWDYQIKEREMNRACGETKQKKIVTALGEKY